MLLIESKAGNILVMLGGMVMLGTWPAVWNHVERAGRLPSHTFIDYGFSYLTTSMFYSFLLGSLGGPVNGRPNIFDQLPQPNGKLAVFAAGAGACLFMGDMTMQYGVALLGLSVAMPLINSLTITISVTLNFFLDSGLNKPYLLFPGAGCFMVATVLGAMAHLKNTEHMRRKQDAASGVMQLSIYNDASNSSRHGPGAAFALPMPMPHRTNPENGCPGEGKSLDGGWQVPDGCDDLVCNRDVDGTVAARHPAAGPLPLPGDAAVAAERPRSIPSGGRSKWLGLAIALCGGTIYGLVYPALNIAINDPFHFLPADVPPLSIYAANFYFGIAFATGSVLTNVVLLYKPVLGIPKSNLSAWFRDNRQRAWSCFAGVLTPSGDLSQVMGGEQLGFAASMMVNAFPLVGTLWGIFLFKEFRGTSRLAGSLLTCQIAFYVTGIALLASSTSSRDIKS